MPGLAASALVEPMTSPRSRGSSKARIVVPTRHFGFLMSLSLWRATWLQRSCVWGGFWIRWDGVPRRWPSGEPPYAWTPITWSFASRSGRRSIRRGSSQRSTGPGRRSSWPRSARQRSPWVSVARTAARSPDRHERSCRGDGPDLTRDEPSSSILERPDDRDT